MKILGISGRRQSGKDTTAAHLRNLLKHRFRVNVASTSDWPKQILYGAGVPREALHGTDAEKSALLPCGASGRDLTRDLYNLLTRHDPAALIGHVIEESRIMRYNLLVMPCIRNIVDVERIHADGGLVVRLDRVPHPGDTHREETELEGYPHFDYHVPDGSPLDAVGNVMQFLNTRGWFDDADD